MNLDVLSSLTTVALGPAQEAWMGTIPTLLNEGLKQIQTRRSWNCMRTSIQFAISGVSSPPFTYALPSNFKELQSGVHALRAVGPDVDYTWGGGLWRIFTQQEVAKVRRIGQDVASRIAWTDQDINGVWSIHFPGPFCPGDLPSGTQFEVDIYQFLPPVAALTDENDLMRRYPMLVLEYCKFLVFSLGSDADSIAAKNEAHLMINGKPGTPGQPSTPGYFFQASADDNSHNVHGRTSRMGGY